MQSDSEKLKIFLDHRAALIEYATPLVGDRMRAEDLVQEAGVRFLPPDEASGRIKKPLGYLYRIVRNLAVDWRRQRRSEAHYIQSADEHTLRWAREPRPSPEAEVIARDQLRALKRALSELPPRTRTAMEMHRLGGRKLKDIAEELGISVTTAHDLIMQGVDYCRRRMDD